MDQRALNHRHYRSAGPELPFVGSISLCLRQAVKTLFIDKHCPSLVMTCIFATQPCSNILSCPRLQVHSERLAGIYSA